MTTHSTYETLTHDTYRTVASAVMSSSNGETKLDIQMREMRAQLDELRKQRQIIQMHAEMAEEHLLLQQAREREKAAQRALKDHDQRLGPTTSASTSASSMVTGYLETVMSPTAEKSMPINNHNENTISVNESSTQRSEIWKQKIQSLVASAASNKANGDASATDRTLQATTPSAKRPAEESELPSAKLLKKETSIEPQISLTTTFPDAEKRLEQNFEALPRKQPEEQTRPISPPQWPRARSPPRYPIPRSSSGPDGECSSYRPGSKSSPFRGYMARSPPSILPSPHMPRFQSPSISARDHSPPRYEHPPPRIPSEGSLPGYIPPAHIPPARGIPKELVPTHHKSIAPTQESPAPNKSFAPRPAVPVYEASSWSEFRNFISTLDIHFKRSDNYFCNDERKIQTGKSVISESLKDQWNAYIQQLPRATWMIFCNFLVGVLPAEGCAVKNRRAYSALQQKPNQSVGDFSLVMMRYKKCWNRRDHNPLRHLWDRVLEPIRKRSDKSWQDFDDFHEIVEHLVNVERAWDSRPPQSPRASRGERPNLPQRGRRRRGRS
ncbi:hypothetical protein N7520_005059 [Penicillium odoratum]|uniref:uncharacterized protein n=1 Tax=Penicillium odoratum TaxID=1167516 RepID=UPI00254939CE|nr:uncharacterized protein N7520_005059 [Penicillium odoratum]KAJ5765500.1 hypothetical protein N7520_005059 [Penicillium odoratum]